MSGGCATPTGRMPQPPQTPAPRTVAAKTVARDWLRVGNAVGKGAGFDQLTGLHRKGLHDVHRELVEAVIDPLVSRPDRGARLAQIQDVLDQLRNGIFAKLTPAQRLS